MLHKCAEKDIVSQIHDKDVLDELGAGQNWTLHLYNP